MYYLSLLAWKSNLGFFFERGGQGRGRMGHKISPKRKTFVSSIKARH